MSIARSARSVNPGCGACCPCPGRPRQPNEDSAEERAFCGTFAHSPREKIGGNGQGGLQLERVDFEMPTELCRQLERDQAELP
ncbi:MAG TPA: hypothetical protein PKL61_16315, partial [Accumulibacter sp.]|uniref:hypothetical protein n=1 Tax=Accumulibacter sp. TaxID=2053492 RepID=UPI002BCF99F4